ncbi:tRNA synthetases class I (M)-domain-containing protein [Dipodascopsis tothii]|uniref:tRNA synthetases class I (M)-domain-containing protein n=1 Tax=Dipodascopsis tothii TaxID=44089 RepID=UPI0034CDDCDE
MVSVPAFHAGHQSLNCLPLGFLSRGRLIRTRNWPGTIYTSRSSSISRVRHNHEASSAGKVDHQPRVESEVGARKPFYITTPIFYINAAPHIGHMYSMVFADCIKRWTALTSGKPALLLTGTDEHGMKVHRAAIAAEMNPREFCDKQTVQFKDLAAESNVHFDYYMRTTKPEHQITVHKIWKILVEKGLIYKGSHSGWYSVSDETFYPEGQIEEVLDPQTGLKKMRSKETGKEVEWSSEENYFFALSQFREPLLQLYKESSSCSEPEKSMIYPQKYLADVISWVSEGLEDLSVSRPRKRSSWGIPVPGDDTQTVYVWLDALTNYLTATKFPWSSKQEYEESAWPADIHLIGKDIVRFHCIYWPAFLLAADLPLPGQILVHSHWQLNGAKMSKSDGNVVDPFYATTRLDSDGARYYMLSQNLLVSDGEYSTFSALERRNGDLVNKYGNLTARICGKKFDIAESVLRGTRRTPTLPEQYRDGHEMIISGLNDLPRVTQSHMKSYNTSATLSAIFHVLGLANKYAQDTEFWSLERESQLSVVFDLAEVSRISSILLQPFLPTYSKKVLDRLGVKLEHRTIDYARYGVDGSYGLGANAPDGGHVMFERRR